MGLLDFFFFFFNWGFLSKSKVRRRLEVRLEKTTEELGMLGEEGLPVLGV